MGDKEHSNEQEDDAKFDLRWFDRYKVSYIWQGSAEWFMIIYDESAKSLKLCVFSHLSFF